MAVSIDMVKQRGVFELLLLHEAKNCFERVAYTKNLLFKKRNPFLSMKISCKVFVGFLSSSNATSVRVKRP